MSLTATVRRWAQNNPQFATSLAMMLALAAFGAMGGDLASFDGGWEPTGGTTVTSGP